MKITLAGKGLSHHFRSNLHKMCAFLENVRIFNLICIKCAHFQKMRAEIAKNKFSDIGLASSKGLFFEDPTSYK